jgi:hypothetical protein
LSLSTREEPRVSLSATVEVPLLSPVWLPEPLFSRAYFSFAAATKPPALPPLSALWPDTTEAESASRREEPAALAVTCWWEEVTVVLCIWLWEMILR